MERTLQDFRRDMTKHNNPYTEVAVRFPYANHEGFRAFEAVNKNGTKVYFCFNSEDVFIQSIVLEVNGTIYNR
jgi:hypothetical protein